MENNVLFSINTVFHLMMAKLYIKKNKLKNVCVVCYAINDEIPKIIEKDTTFRNKLILKRDENYKNKIDNAIKFRSNILSLHKFLDANKFNCILVFKDNDIFNQIILEHARKENIKTILIEEGFGIYTKPKEGYTVKEISKVKQYLLRYPKYTYNAQGINPLINEIYVTNTNLLPDIKKENKKISLIDFNKTTERGRRNLFKYFNIRDIKFTDNSNKITVLYMSQPLSEFNLLGYNVEQEKLNKLFKILIDCDVNVLIKPHPSENINKYRFILNKSSIKFIKYSHIPVELLPSYFNIDLAITVHSSSSLYLKEWYGIKTISIADIFVNLDNEKRKILTNHYKIDFIEKLDDLRKILEC